MSSLSGEHEFHIEQAPGFKKYGPDGEELVCRQQCYMQGRIDATAGFDRRFMAIMTQSAHFKPLMWDAKVLEYHDTKHAGTTATLLEIIDESNSIVTEGRDSDAQQPPKGWAQCLVSTLTTRSLVPPATATTRRIGSSTLSKVRSR